MNILDDLPSYYYEWFGEIGQALKSLLDPFERLADHIHELFFVEAVDISYETKKKVAKNKQKAYRRYMDDIYRVQYRQLAFIKVIPKDLPYQRRNY